MCLTRLFICDVITHSVCDMTHPYVTCLMHTCRDTFMCDRNSKFRFCVCLFVHCFVCLFVCFLLIIRSSRNLNKLKAVCCGVFPCGVVCCSVLQCVAVCCNVCCYVAGGHWANSTSLLGKLVGQARQHYWASSTALKFSRDRASSPALRRPRTTMMVVRLKTVY